VDLFFALSVVPPSSYRVLNSFDNAKILIAFEYAEALNRLNKIPTKLMLDSGAFTAWTSNTKVDLNSYGVWATNVARNYGSQLVCVNLDVIPGQSGRTSTHSERKAAMAGSLDNANKLRSMNVNVAEVFHQDEPWTYLHDLLDRLPENGVLCVSPRNDVGINMKIKWQREVLHNLLKRYKLKDIPKTHGLAVTSKRMLEQFPYYSVDSSTWCSSLRFGSYVNERGGMTPMKSHLGVSPRTNTPGTQDLFVRKSMQNLQHLERGITSLWMRRGLVWTK